jgi:predicted kinase
VEKADRILMRAAGDYRSDVIVKREFLNQVRAEGYNPRLVVDDRPSVCNMWVEEGITTLQHINQIDEWDERGSWDHGTLHLMVGPSGAGKSSFARSLGQSIHWKTDDILSTDEMREKITGDFEDQSANDQVFYSIKAIAEARLRSGLTTVIDGTNLRARNRREFRDLIPQNAPLGSIHYWVIDRPLAEKHTTAGWRDKVIIPHKTVGDEKLVDRHHRIFQAVKKDVLRGDGDARVMVHDYRSE